MARRGFRSWALDRRAASLWLVACVGLAGALGDARVFAHDAAGAPRAEGAHLATASVGEAGASFELKCGFSVRVPARVLREARAATLRIAPRRAEAAGIAPGFVPIGPTVELDAAIAAGHAAVEVSYRADRFRPRAGHKLVLALERPAACQSARATACSRWELIDAAYEAGACRARVPETTGLRLQFGSVPADPAAQMAP